MKNLEKTYNPKDFEKKISEDKDCQKHLSWLKAFINK